MNNILTAKEYYLTEFRQLQPTLTGHDIAWLSDLRQQAIARFDQLGFPTSKQEQWKYTRTTAIEKYRFKSTTAAKDVPTLADIQAFLLTPSFRLVFVDGHFHPELSQLPETLPTGMVLTHLANAFVTHTHELETHLACHAHDHDRHFAALNTAFMSDGLYLKLAPKTIVTHPIHALFIATTENSIQHPRNFIFAGDDSQATIIEHYISLKDVPYFTNTITELAIEQQAKIQHIKLQQESNKAFHIGTTDVHQQQNSDFTSHVFTLGSELTRSDTHVKLAGDGANCVLNGLYLLTQQQHADHHTCIDHSNPHTKSREYYKGVLHDQSRAVFNGKIIVQNNAKHTEAEQKNQNLLLSKGAEIDTKPELEIYTDEVKCRHGATVGQLSEDALFYLRSRGIPEDLARNILVYAFAKEMIEQLDHKPLRDKLQLLLTPYEKH